MHGRDLRRVRAKFGMVFQHSALLDSMTVLDNIGLPLVEHENLTRRQVDERARALLDSLGLEGCEALLPSQISGGMRKRVALAGVLIRRPSILVYDEPASGLDPVGARNVDDLAGAWRGRRPPSYRGWCSTKGRLVASRPPAELRQDAGSLAARFFEASRPSL